MRTGPVLEEAPSTSPERTLKGRQGLLLLVLLVGALFVSAAALQGIHWARNRAYAQMGPVCRVETGRHLVALTFDDGPDPAYTPQVLSLLSRNGARATFFVLGESASRWPALVKSELETGMEVGDHTWDHPHLPSMSSDSAFGEVSRTRNLLRRYGAEVALFRAPYGGIRADDLSRIEHSGLRVVHWSIAVDHYVGGLALGPAEASQALLEAIRPGDIILAHDAHVLPQDGGGNRAAAMATLERLVPELRARGFTITTVSHLVTAGIPVRAKPRIWFWQSGFYCP